MPGEVRLDEGAGPLREGVMARTGRGGAILYYCVYEDVRRYTPRRGDRPAGCYRTKSEARRHLRRLRREGRKGTMMWHDIIGQEYVQEVAEVPGEGPARMDTRDKILLWGSLFLIVGGVALTRMK